MIQEEIKREWRFASIGLLCCFFTFLLSTSRADTLAPKRESDGKDTKTHRDTDREAGDERQDQQGGRQATADVGRKG